MAYKYNEHKGQKYNPKTCIASKEREIVFEGMEHGWML